MRIPFFKIPDIDVVSPSKSGNPFNAGIDFYVPRNAYIEIDKGSEKDHKWIKLGTDSDKVTIWPGHEVLIHSGIKLEIDFSQAGIVFNRSGIASKHNCVVGSCVIDTFYSGELCFDVHNIGYECFDLKGGDKIVQMLVLSYISCTPYEVKDENVLYEDMKAMSIRGNDGFGSTDKK